MKSPRQTQSQPCVPARVPKRQQDESPQPLELQEGKEPRIDSRLLAKRLNQDHRSTYRLITRYKSDFETLAKLRFQIAPSADSATGQKERFAFLTEDQAYFLLTMSRNTQRVVRLKLELVKAFAQARKRMATNELEYLPAYHDLHDAIARAAGDSPNARWAHINCNKAVNKAVGIEAGQRKSTNPIAHSLMVVATVAAAQAVARAGSIKDVQPAINAALAPLTALHVAGAGALEVQR